MAENPRSTVARPHNVRCVADDAFLSVYDTETGKSHLELVPRVLCSCGAEGYLPDEMTAMFSARVSSGLSEDYPALKAVAIDAKARVPPSFIRLVEQIGTDIIQERRHSEECIRSWASRKPTTEQWRSRSFKSVGTGDDPDQFIEDYLAEADPKLADHADVLRASAAAMTSKLRRRFPSDVGHDRWERAIRRSLDLTFKAMVGAQKTDGSLEGRLKCAVSCNVGDAPSDLDPRDRTSVRYVILSRGYLRPSVSDIADPRLMLCTPVREVQRDAQSFEDAPWVVEVTHISEEGSVYRRV